MFTKFILTEMFLKLIRLHNTCIRTPVNQLTRQVKPTKASKYGNKIYIPSANSEDLITITCPKLEQHKGFALAFFFFFFGVAPLE